MHWGRDMASPSSCIRLCRSQEKRRQEEVSTISLIELQMNGTVDHFTSVQCHVTIDPDNLDVQGRVLVIPGRVAFRFSFSPGGSTFYRNASGELTWVCGWLNFPPKLSLPTYPVRVGYDYFSLGAQLGDRELEVLEDMRAGGDLQALFQMMGLIRVLAPPVKNEGTREPQWRPWALVRVETGSPGLTGGASFRVPRERWLSLLGKLGKERFLVELPVLRLPEGVEAWKQVLGEYVGAEGQYRQGQYEYCLMDCRKVIEGVARVLSRCLNVEPVRRFAPWVDRLAAQLRTELPQRKDRIDTLSALMVAAWAWSSKPHHYGGATPIRDEAATALHLIATVLTMAAQLVAEWESRGAGALPDQDEQNGTR